VVGLVNVVLYTVTRNIIPLPFFLRKALGLRSNKDTESSEDDEEKGGWTRLSRQVSSPANADFARGPSPIKQLTSSPKQLQPSLIPNRKSSLAPQQPLNLTEQRVNLSRQGSRSSSNAEANPFTDSSRASPSSSPPGNASIIASPPQIYQPKEDNNVNIKGKGKKNSGNGLSLVRTNSNASNSGEIVTSNNASGGSGSGLRKWNSTSSTSSASSGRPGSIDSVSSGSSGTRKAGRITTTVAKDGRKVIKKPQPAASMEFMPVV
jgi:hypothetical protein